MAMFLAGLLKSPVVRRPTNQPAGAELDAIRRALKVAEMLQRRRPEAGDHTSVTSITWSARKSENYIPWKLYVPRTAAIT